MTERIRWKKIKYLVTSLLRKDVQIHLTTSLTNVVAFICEEDNQVKILISSMRCKTEEEVIVAIAHEISHVQAKTNDHTNEFYEQMDKNISFFEKELNLLNLRDIIPRLEGDGGVST